MLADARRIPRDVGPVDGVLTSPPYPGVYSYLDFTPPASGLAAHVESGYAHTAATGSGPRTVAREIGSKAEKSELDADPALGSFTDRWQADTVAWLEAATAVLRPSGRIAILIGDDSGINCLESITAAAATISTKHASSHTLHVIGSASLSSQATRPWARQSSRGRGYRREHTILLERLEHTEHDSSRLVEKAATWPAPMPIPDCHATSVSAGTNATVHVVGVIARRRMLGKRLAFVDLQEEGDTSGERARVQVLLRAASAGGEGLDRELWRHELVPGTRVAVLGQLLSEDASNSSPPASSSASPPASSLASPPSRTLLVRELIVRHVAPCDQGVASLVAAVHTGTLEAVSGRNMLTTAHAPTDDAAHDAADQLATQLLEPTSRAQGVLAEDDESHQTRVRELARLLAAASPPHVVALARSGGGHSHAGLVPGRQVASLAFLYGGTHPDGGGEASGGDLLLSHQVEEEIQAAHEAGGALGAAAALDRPTLTTAAALRAVEDGATNDDGWVDGWVTLEGEVVSRLRIKDDIARRQPTAASEREHSVQSGSRAVLLRLHDGPTGEGGRATSVESGDLRSLLHPALLLTNNLHKDGTAADGTLDSVRLETFTELCAQGARVRIVGRWAPPPATHPPAGMPTASSASSPNVAALPVLLVFAIRLERCAGVLRVVKSALEALSEGRLTDAEAARSLAAPGSQAAPLTRDLLSTESRAAKSWRAAELAAALRRADPAAALRCEATRAIIDSCNDIRQRYPVRPLTIEPPKTAAPRRRASSASPPLLAARTTGLRSTGANTDGSFWNVKKRPQLLFMGAQVEALLTAHPEWRQRPLRIIDIGGGKGLFAEYLARTFGEAVSVTLVDVVGKRLAQARARMARRGGTVPPNLELVQGDAAALAALGELERVDVACGMHACGGLSDLIIAHAVEQGAAFAVSTCCFHSNMQLAIPGDLPRDDWLSRTDGAPSVSTEQRSRIHTLLRTAELTDSPAAAHESAHAINAMRAAAAEASWATTWAGSELRPPRMRAEVVQYDAKFSARNQIVIGRPSWGTGGDPHTAIERHTSTSLL